MIIPKNGRVVIVDDNPSEAAPLMAILSKRRIPFNYYSGEDLAEFPDDSESNRFRVLFLDLNIVETNKKVQDVISVLNGILVKLVPEGSNPYLLVIWSKKAEYQEALLDHFQNVLPKRKPIETIFLNKGDYFDLDVASGSYVEQANAYEKLTVDLETHLANLSVLGSLFDWENLVHDESLATVNEFASFFAIDAEWDINLKGLIRKLAQAAVGKELIGTASDSKQIELAFGHLNSFLSDRLEEKISAQELGHVANIDAAPDNLPANIVARINAKLHLSSVTPALGSSDQGNIYLINRNKPIYDLMISTKTVNKEVNVKAIRDLRPKQVRLDLTPVCDYAQDKGYTRLVNGILIPSAMRLNIKSPSFIYATPVFKWKSEEMFILFDFRFIETVTKKEIRKLRPSFRLRKEICTDVQAQLSNQMNRPGISNL